MLDERHRNIMAAHGRFTRDIFTGIVRRKYNGAHGAPRVAKENEESEKKGEIYFPEMSCYASLVPLRDAIPTRRERKREKRGVNVAQNETRLLAIVARYPLFPRAHTRTGILRESA